MESVVHTRLSGFRILAILLPLYSSPGNGQVYEKLFSFTDARAAEIAALTTKGIAPRAGLAQGIDGNYYGTTSRGGVHGLGTVFRLTPAGKLTTLIEFSGNESIHRGSVPLGELVFGPDGNFYGTTSEGGALGHGTVFRLSPNGNLTTLIDFTGNGVENKGASPMGGLTLGVDGFFYGTTREGGLDNLGTVFKLHPAGNLTTLFEFTGTAGSHPGSFPEGTVVQGSDGAFYGTTSKGGLSDHGTVFKLLGGTLTSLVNFTGIDGTHKGSAPLAALLEAEDTPA